MDINIFLCSICIYIYHSKPGSASRSVITALLAGASGLGRSLVLQMPAAFLRNVLGLSTIASKSTAVGLLSYCSRFQPILQHHFASLARPVPPPRGNFHRSYYEFMTDGIDGLNVESFLKVLGRGCPEQAKKFDGWGKLFTTDSVALKKAGVPIQQRRWILAWVEKYRFVTYRLFATALN